MLARAFAYAAIFAASIVAHAQTVPPPGEGQPVPPPLSRPKAEYYRAHPGEWDQVLKQVPKIRTVPARPGESQIAPPRVDTWTRTKNLPPASGLGNPLLLTDGTVI